MLPPNYKTTLENADVLVMRVHYGPHEFVLMHDHSEYPTIYVYLNDSGEVQISHDGPKAEVLTRPPTHTGAFRISLGGSERHSVRNLGDTPSDFLRVEMKSLPKGSPKHMFRGNAPALPLAAGTTEEYRDDAFALDRTICPAASGCSLSSSAERSLLIAVSPNHLKVGREEHDLKAGDVFWLPPTSGPPPSLSAGAHCLRLVFHTPPPE